MAMSPEVRVLVAAMLMGPIMNAMPHDKAADRALQLADELLAKAAPPETSDSGEGHVEGSDERSNEA